MGQKGKGHQYLNFTRDDHSIDMLGHELGNVLNGLLGMSGLMRESSLNSEQERWLTAIEHCGEQMTLLIETFREPGNGIREVVEPRPRLIDGLGVLEQTIISHLPAAQRRGNRLFLTIDPDLPRYWNGDPCLLRQLLDNLLGNAIKFTRSGEIVVEALAGGVDQNSNTLSLEVRDSGVGIEPSDGGRIFEAYGQGHSTERSKHAGIGLGLFICHRIVQSMNGTITWSSPTGGGTCFEIELPGLLSNNAEGQYPTSSIMSSIHCVIGLEQPLQTSFANFLTRLNVSWNESESTSPEIADRPLQLLVSEADLPCEVPGPTVLLTPRTGSYLPAPRILATPILESTLEQALLEIGLEWNCIRVANHAEAAGESDDAVYR
jgi:hypothetical protein